jgi:hypothetical protein
MSEAQTSPKSWEQAGKLITNYRRAQREARRRELACKKAWNVLIDALWNDRAEDAAILLGSPQLVEDIYVARSKVTTAMFWAGVKDAVACMEKLLDLAESLQVPYEGTIEKEMWSFSLAGLCAQAGSLAMADLLLARDVFFGGDAMRTVMAKASEKPEVYLEMAKKILACRPSTTELLDQRLMGEAEAALRKDPQNVVAKFVRDEARARAKANRAANPGPIRRIGRWLWGRFAPAAPAPGKAH